MSPSTSLSPVACESTFTNTKGPHSSTRMEGSRTSLRFQFSTPSNSGATSSAPSSEYVHPWYGHRRDFAQPLPSRMVDARWRHTFEKARRTPSFPRTIAHGSPTISELKYDPGDATFAAWPTGCHVCQKIFSFSLRRNCGSVYQLE